MKDKYYSCSATVLMDLEEKDEDVIRCPKCGAPMMHITLSCDFGVAYDPRHIIHDTYSRQIVEHSAWICKLECDKLPIVDDVIWQGPSKLEMTSDKTAEQGER